MISLSSITNSAQTRWCRPVSMCAQLRCRGAARVGGPGRSTLRRSSVRGLRRQFESGSLWHHDDIGHCDVGQLWLRDDLGRRRRGGCLRVRGGAAEEPAQRQGCTSRTGDLQGELRSRSSLVHDRGVSCGPGRRIHGRPDWIFRGRCRVVDRFRGGRGDQGWHVRGHAIGRHRGVQRPLDVRSQRANR